MTSAEEYSERMKKQMELNDAEAYKQMCLEYLVGNSSIPKDKAKALKLFMKAGELGSATAYYDAAGMYYEGKGVARDVKKVDISFKLLL